MFGFGYALPNESVRHLPSDRRLCYRGGWGGSIVIDDLDQGLVGDERGTALTV